MNKPLNLLVIIPSFYPAVIYGGPIFSSYNTCKALVKTGTVKVTVATTNTNMYSRLDVPTDRDVSMDGFSVRYFNETIVDKLSLAFLFNSWKYIKKADVIHIQSIFNTTTPISIIYSRLFQKKMLLSPRGVMGDWVMGQGNRFKKLWLKMFIAPFLTSITWHATAEQEKKEIRQHFPNASIIVVPNGIDIEMYAVERYLSKKEYIKKYTKKDFHEDTEVIVSMGRIHKKKSFELLIQAVSLLSQRKANVLLLIAGQDEGELKQLETLIKDLNLSEKVFFVGPLEGTAKVDFLVHADVFALTSQNENFGNVYAEALASGLPILFSPQTPWQGAESAGCGMEVSLDESKIAHALEILLLQNKNEVKQKAHNFIQQYSWQSIAQTFSEELIKIR